MKKIRSHKKNQNSPKVTHAPGIPSKAQPQAPRELGDIQNLAKTFLFREKKFSVNSSSFLFKESKKLIFATISRESIIDLICMQFREL